MLQVAKNKYHLGQAILAKLKTRANLGKLTIIGITGTDGKTTTATLLYKILTKAGIKTAVVTTIGAYIGDKFYETGFHTTTPSSFALQKYLKLALQENCTNVILETTSHALDQNRTWGIPFKIGILTNITHEHLDYHKTYENYLGAKAKLLKRAKKRILNMDDASYDILRKQIGDKELFGYSLHNKNAYATASDLPSKLSIMGEFNKQNALAAIAAAKLLGVSSNVIKNAVSEFTAPDGRQEVVHDDEFRVIVDFAHTPGSFEKILPEIKKMTTGRLIHVFGAAGKRDALKRPHMGNSSSKYADIIVLTAEDPRGESVEMINTHIMAGFQKEVDLHSIPNRRKAIEKALSLAQKGDIVLLTGKGHEKTINYDGSEIPWSDKEAVFEILDKHS
ncbi:MAG TPA: UDP-N-acetylmuramyl-tripeptide synthetase [Candidatus Levybacteria bacterium]|nr:UDP-N-acetylmuramyl-tripeptide synthetase [Candidatus Levybacteria bacterium]